MNHKGNIFGDKRLNLARLVRITATLEQLHEREGGKRASFMCDVFDEPAGFLVTAQVPDQNVRIKYYVL